MMKHEFEQLVMKKIKSDFYITPEEYMAIELKYMESGYEGPNCKNEFVADWLARNGIQLILDGRELRIKTLEKEFEVIMEKKSAILNRLIKNIKDEVNWAIADLEA